MIPPIPTAISFLSKYSLALSLASIPDPIRNKLDATVRHFSHFVALSTIAVAIGVLMEGVELVLATVEWWKRKRHKKRELIQLEEIRQIIPVGNGAQKSSKAHSEEPIWVKFILRVGIMLVVVGVVGEWRCGAKLEDAHNAVHEYDIALLGDAARSAKDANDLGTDLLEKYKTAEREIVELKAAKLPRRLSSDQKEIFLFAVTSFTGETFDISCATPGGDAKEPLDFESDFLEAMRRPMPKFRKVPVHVTYLTTCNTMLGGATFIPPIQIEVSADRQGDAAILVKALKDIGINKKDIKTKPRDRKDFLGMSIGPKSP